MRVKLIPLDNQKELDKLFTACRTCYNTGSPIDMYNEIDEIDNNKKIKLINQVLDSGHESVIEHCNITFLISGIDRATSLQLARHRLISRSEKSQRYVTFKDGNFDYVCPNTIKNNEEAKRNFDECIKKISNTYSELIKIGIKAEDARFILPNATCTDMVLTMNVREFMHLCNERLCSCSQEPIRKLVKEMANQMGEEFQFLKKYFVPKCEKMGYCNESPQRSCGRKSLKEDVLKG